MIRKMVLMGTGLVNLRMRTRMGMRMKHAVAGEDTATPVEQDPTTQSTESGEEHFFFENTHQHRCIIIIMKLE